MNKIHPLILCGGSGKRLWPISRTRSPKQFQKIGNDASVSFFQAAIQRHQGELFNQPCIVTSLRHRGIVKKQLGEIQSGGQIICEPVPRSTGPAVLAAAFKLHEENAEALILIVPADHVLEEDINSTIEACTAAALKGHIITFGIRPRGPECGFGYLVPCEPLPAFPDLMKVEQFIEKPETSKAQDLIEKSGATWASGIVLFSAQTLIHEYEKFDPETAAYVKFSVLRAASLPDAIYLDATAFGQATPGSTETIVFENSERVVTQTLNVTWNDVGSWSAMFEIAKPDSDGNVFHGDVVSVGSTNTMVRSEKRLVGVVGLEDIIIVDTPDALLVTHRCSSQRVKELVDTLKNRARTEAEYYSGAAPKMVTLSAFSELERGSEHDAFDVGTGQLPLGGFLKMEAGSCHQMIVVKGTVEAQGSGWKKTVENGGRIYADPTGPVHVTNAGNCDVQFLFMTFGNHTTSTNASAVFQNA